MNATTRINDDERVGRPLTWGIALLFIGAAFFWTFRSIGELGSHVVGNSGDPLFVSWTLGWVQHAIPDGWDSLWNADIFAPAHNTLAYSDPMMAIAILHWPLRAIFGATAGQNVLAVASVAASMWFTYCIALKLTLSRAAGAVAGLAFGLSTPVLSGLGHYQLTMTIAFVPLTMLLAIRLFEKPTLARGAAVGASLGLLTISALYYGIMMTVALVVTTIAALVLIRPPHLKRLVAALTLGAIVAGVLAIPVALQYLELQRNSAFKRGPDPTYWLQPEDLISGPSGNILLGDLPGFDSRVGGRAPDTQSFPGFAVIAFATAGAVVVARGFRNRGADEKIDLDNSHPPENLIVAGSFPWRMRITIAIVIGGIASAVIALGEWWTIFGQRIYLPFHLLRNHVPGFAGIRVASRFFLMAEFALVIVAAFGVQALLKRAGSRAITYSISAVLIAFVLVETAIDHIPLVRTPHGSVEAVNRKLSHLPDGPVLELPIRGPADLASWPYLEAPRMYLSLDDNHPRINGYSGFAPPQYDQRVATLNTFPSTTALEEIDHLDVRYVVLRTKVAGEQTPDIAAGLHVDGYGRLTNSSAKTRIAEIPPERIRNITRLPGAYLVELKG